MMKNRSLKRKAYAFVANTSLSVPAYYTYEAYMLLRYKLYGYQTLTLEEVRNVEENVTFIYKSFNRQSKAKRLYRSIRSYFPSARIIIADDSAVPLEIPGAEIIHLPFNSGLSKGLIAAIERVETPYLMRLDDDMLLLPQSHIPQLLRFLQRHGEVDLAAVQGGANPEKRAAQFLEFDMGKEMLIPKGTEIDGFVVSCKTPNWFLARTESIRRVGYDPNIRMIDHHEFFFRAAGQIVSVMDPHSFLFHCHNRFERNDYGKYRGDIRGDVAYIWEKHRGANFR